MAKRPARTNVQRQTNYVVTPYAVVKANNFTGGLNTGIPSSINDNELTEAINTDYTPEGVITSRRGCVRQFTHAFSTRPIVNLGALQQTNVTHSIFATDTELYALASTAPVQTPTLLLGAMPTTTYVDFAQLSNILVICNGIQPPRSYNGTVLTSLATAPVGRLICNHRNRLFMAHASALFFSALFNPQDWSSAGESGAGQINVNPDDGDQIQCILPTAFALLIAKERKSYFLQGHSPNTFNISGAMEGGTVSPKGIVWTPLGFFRIDHEGVWFTDFRRQNLLTSKIQSVWNSLNQQRLSQASMYFFDSKLLISLPSQGSNVNDLVLLYSLNHNAWSLWRGWNASCFATRWIQGVERHFYGSSLIGNTFEIEQGHMDDGNLIETSIATKNFTFGFEERLKRFKWFDATYNNGNQLTPVTLEAFTDGAGTNTHHFVLPKNIGGNPYRMGLVPHGKGVRVRTTFRGPASLQSIAFTFYLRGDRPERVG